MCAVLCTATASAQTPLAPASESVPEEPLRIETYQAPRPKHLVVPDFPWKENLNGSEGWVTLGFMVDSTGKPFEIAILSSTGNKRFEDLALKAMNESTFEPGSLNRKPIESASELRYKFINTSYTPGAHAEFITAYKAFNKALDANDRAAADAALKSLKINTLYEDAYYGFVTYQYASRWGDERDQIAALGRAIGDASQIPYFSQTTARELLLARLRLQLNARNYGEAMTTWSRLQKIGVDPSIAKTVQPVIDQLVKIRSNDQAYDVSGIMDAGNWSLHLFKHHFRAVVAQGYISQVKLRCAKGYVYFAFDPALEYEVHNKYGDCMLTFEGAPGTRFTLTQH
jgi:TonB family protein